MRLERWQSGRMHRTRNAEYSQGYRGFESHPLRQRFNKNSRLSEVVGIYPRGNPGEPCSSVANANGLARATVLKSIEGSPTRMGTG